MIEIKIPATTANLGPGFDCLGMALNLYNKFYIEELNDGLEFIGFDEEFQNENNLVYVAMRKTFEIIGYNYKGLKISLESDIPISRGLGSSAACILGGVLGANTIAGGVLNKLQLLKIASDLDGHPDNIAPALFGGVTVAVKSGDEVFYDKIKFTSKIKLTAFIPEFHLSTKDARAVLPTMIPRNDAVFNVGRSTLLATAFANGNLDLIKAACEDRLHEPYRGKLIKNYNAIISKCKSMDPVAVFLSGAGPTIMAMLKEDDNKFIPEMKNYLSSLSKPWNVKELEIDFHGSIVQVL